MEEEQLKIDVAVLKSEVTTLKADIQELKDTVTLLTEVLKEVKSLLDQYKGFAAAVILIGMVLGWLLSYASNIKDAIKTFFTS